MTKTIILLPLKNPRFKEIPIVNKKIEKFLLNCSIFILKLSLEIKSLKMYSS